MLNLLGYMLLHAWWNGWLMSACFIVSSLSQGWARDVKTRDRDETGTLTFRDRDVGFTSRDETETRH